MKLKIAAAVAALSVLAACGEGAVNPNATPSPTSASPAVAAPKRIVSMSASATEMLFAIGAGPQVVAVDSNSNFPAEAPKSDLSAYEPNVESIVKLTPDLVVISDDIKNLKAQLTTLKIPVLHEPAAKTLDDSYAQITELGEKTGHAAEAAALVASMKQKVADLLKEAPKPAAPLSYFYELDNTLYTVTSKTFIGQLFTLAGLANIADPADKAGGGYPQLSAEFLVKADPDLVFLADTKCCKQDATTFAARPGFGKLKAVKNGDVVALDDDVASRWGPRVTDLLSSIVTAAKAAAA